MTPSTWPHESLHVSGVAVVARQRRSHTGKYFELLFDRFGTPKGGVVTNYLLEKSRTVKPGRGERNFHIFYQLVAGATDRAALKLAGSAYTSDAFSMLLLGLDRTGLASVCPTFTSRNTNHRYLSPPFKTPGSSLSSPFYAVPTYTAPPTYTGVRVVQRAERGEAEARRRRRPTSAP